MSIHFPDINFMPPEAFPESTTESGYRSEISAVARQALARADSPENPRNPELLITDIHEFVTSGNELHEIINNSALDGLPHNADDAQDPANPMLNLGPNTLMGLLGVIGINEGVNKAKISHQTGDSTSLKQSFLRVFKGFSEGLDSFSNGISNGVRGLGSESLASKCAQSLSVISILGASGGALAFLGISTLNLKETIGKIKTVYPHLKNISTDQEMQIAFNVLKNELSVNDSDRSTLLKNLLKKQSSIEKFTDFVGNKLFKEKIPKEFLNALKNPCKETIEKAFEKAPTTFKTDSSFNAFKTTLDPKILASIENLPQATKTQFYQLLEHAYAEAIPLEHQRKESVFIRMFGDETFKDFKVAIESESPIPAAKQKSLIQAAKSGIKASLIKSTLKMFMALLLSAGVILAQVSTAGLFFFIETGISLFTSALALGMDAYRLYKALKSTSMSKKDKVLTALSSLFIIGLTLAATIVVKFATNSIATIALTACWGLVIIYTLYIWLRKEEKHSTMLTLTPITTAVPQQVDDSGVDLPEEEVPMPTVVRPIDLPEQEPIRPAPILQIPTAIRVDGLRKRVRNQDDSLPEVSKTKKQKTKTELTEDEELDLFVSNIIKEAAASLQAEQLA